MINEDKSSCYLEPESYKQGVYSPYNELCVIKKTNQNQKKYEKNDFTFYYIPNPFWM